LGICGTDFDNDSKPLISTHTNKSLLSTTGYGYCLHASSITTNHSRLFWTEIFSYRPNPPDVALDDHVGNYCIRSHNDFHIFGSNFLYPSSQLNQTENTISYS